MPELPLSPRTWVSIHAPARVRHATVVVGRRVAAFQSTHPRGCDVIRVEITAEMERFNPRTREGATCFHMWQYIRKIVSIHAPARLRRGRTDLETGAVTFQSTHPRGCDDDQVLRHDVLTGFNPRTREGATSRIRARHMLSARFNPRTREGATQTPPCPLPVPEVSIHAPARVRPAIRQRQLRDDRVSIHAPARVRPGRMRRQSGQSAVSIHAPARVRRTVTAVQESAWSFQSTHPRGCDRSLVPSHSSMPTFQSTHPRGCDS